MDVDRLAESDTERISRLEKELSDLRSTLLARASSMPTGTVMVTYAAIAPLDTLLLQGQTLLRADYAALWAWATNHGAVTQEAFGPGNGTTTFTLPDMRGVVPIGAGTGQGGTYTLGDISGSATRVITTSSLPTHSHGIAPDGDHGGHLPGTGFVLAPAGSASGLLAWDNPGQTTGEYHNHGGTASAGSGNPFDVRQPTIGMNWLVYI